MKPSRALCVYLLLSLHQKQTSFTEDSRGKPVWAISNFCPCRWYWREEGGYLHVADLKGEGRNGELRRKARKLLSGGIHADECSRVVMRYQWCQPVQHGKVLSSCVALAFQRNLEDLFNASLCKHMQNSDVDCQHWASFGIVRFRVAQERQFSYESTIDARSHNHYCHGKTISLTYSVCFCSFSYPAFKTHALFYIVICGLSVCAIFFHVIS